MSYRTSECSVSCTDFESDLDSHQRGGIHLFIARPPWSSLKPSLHQSSFLVDFQGSTFPVCFGSAFIHSVWGPLPETVGGCGGDMSFSVFFFSGALEDKNVDLSVVLPLISQKRNQQGKTKGMTRLSCWHHGLWTKAPNFSIDMLIRMEAC